MINQRTMPAEEFTDTELVSRCLAGDRDAFSRIVSRYQILICSLAYNRLGNLGQSDDVAQETFIVAWKHLRLLREPEKLRSWLCGIVRNRLHKHVRRETREPACQAGSLEEVRETPAVEAWPCEQAIGREEEAILWRALEQVPDLYREPLILFYRQNQSVSEVASALELTEDNVKQRLSRGRKLLQEEVQTFVENTLRRTAPGRTFSGAVLAALPVGPAATAGMSAVGKGAAVAKTGFLGAWFVLLAPLLGVLTGLLSQLIVVRATSTGRARRNQTIRITAFFMLMPGLAMAGEQALAFWRQHYGWADPVYYEARTGFWWLFAAGLAAWLVVQLRRIQAGQAPSPGAMNLKPGAHALIVAATNFTMFAWLISVAYGAGDPATAVILTGLMVGLGFWDYFGVHGQDGPTLVRTTFSRLAVYGLIVLLVFNLRLDVWMATARRVSLAEIHALFSPWILPALTLMLIAWIALVWAVTKPAQPEVSEGSVHAG
jgi:RNA polymerase sigma factor (sigma-70 family)